jgi:hypothetical protein
MKREDNNRRDDNSNVLKKNKKYTNDNTNNWTIQSESIDIDEQLYKYRKRMNNLQSCYNKVDPLNPSMKLNTTYPLYQLKDSVSNYWCFNLITLWEKVSSYENYDLQKMQSHFGTDYILTEIRTPSAIFKINIQDFYNIKNDFYNYAYQINLP